MGEDRAAGASGAELFETPKLAIDRLPQLRGVFERLASTCVDDFRRYCTAPVTFFLNQVETGDSWDVLDAYEDSIAAIFYVPEWDAQILIAVDRRFIFSSIDAMFGSDGTEAQAESARAFSSLEVHLMKDFFQTTAASLKAGLAPIADVTLTLDRVETTVEFTVLGPRNIPAVFAQVLFQVYDSGGRMLVLIPQAPIYPLRKKLERSTLRETQAEDPNWSQQMRSRVATAGVRAQAFLDGPVLTLGEVANLRVGQVLKLDTAAIPEVVLECAKTPLFTCTLGQLDGKLCVKVEATAEKEKGLFDEVIGEAMKSWNAKH